MGNFSSRASLAGVPGAGSIEYKEHFDALAAVLAEFAVLIAHTTLIFVPGDNDAWPSAFSAGASAPLPRKAVPTIFTSRIRRVVAEANREIWGVGAAKTSEKGKESKKKEGEVVWTTNPSRLSWFGIKGEMVLFRDDVLGRLSRTAIRFGNPKGDKEHEEAHVASPIVEQEGANDTQPMDLDPPLLHNQPEQLDPDILTARALTRTLLSQSHLSPFPLSTRPLHWDYASSLSLYPLPSALVLADKEAPAFVVKYSGCTVMNPGPISEGVGMGRGQGKARWVEFDVGSGKGSVRNEG
jgi:DNA polymerase epsilon subunit 2